MVNRDPREPDDYDGYVNYITGRTRGLCEPFVKVRREAAGWRWTCSQCPPNPRTKLLRGGLHKHWNPREYRYPHKRAFNRCWVAVRVHLKLHH